MTNKLLCREKTSDFKTTENSGVECGTKSKW